MGEEQQVGPSEEPAKETDANALALLAVFPWALLIAGYLFFVPQYVEVYRDLTMALPPPTRLALALARPLPLGILSLVALSGVALSLACGSRKLALATLVAGLLTLVCASGAIFLPLLKAGK